MMARPRFLDLQICFDTDYSFSPLKIKINSEILILQKGKTFLPIIVSSIDQKIDVEFIGYVPEDKAQKIIVDVYFKKSKLDTTSLSTFQTKDNRYAENVVLKKYNTIDFNGILTLQFFKSWFECNILNGSQICNKKRFLHEAILNYSDNNLRCEKEKKDYDIICFGCSVTYGSGVKEEDTWPYLLGKKLNVSVGNFGTAGMSIHGCLRQLLFCLENYTAKKFIILLPNFERVLHKFKFLNNSAYYNFTCNSDEKNMMYKFFDYVKLIKYTFENSHKDGKRIINYFNKLNANMYLTSWSSEVYAAIPDGGKKLPPFPSFDTFTERAMDGQHPHKKHYELFVESILPYIQ
jgi:hypothetical protein